MLPRLPQWAIARKYPLLAAAIIVLAVGVRVALIAGGWPGTDSDEATMGVMAKHILTRGEHPIFFYGQAYMGTIEAYVGAGMYALFGVSLFALKCGLILLYAVFMGIMYHLLSMLFDQRWALVGLLLFAFGSDAMLYHELSAWGGYLETLCFGALLTLLAVWLARTTGAGMRQRWRVVGFAAWGLTAGLGIWSDPLVAPFVGLSGLLLVLLCWAEVRHWLGAVALLGLLIGVAPWIVYIVTAPTPAAAASFLQNPVTTQTKTVAPSVTLFSVADTVAQHVLGTVVIAIPNNTGANVFCPSLTVNQAWPPTQWQSTGIQACIVVRSVWGSGFIALLLLTMIIEGRAFWALWRTSSVTRLDDEQQRLAITGGRLVALLGPSATILFFTISSSSSFAPWQYARYLISILIALPVMLGTLREFAGTHQRMQRPWGAFLRYGLPSLLIGTFALASIATFGEIPAQQSQNRQQDALIHTLIQQGDTRIYSDYWNCMWLIFQSNERIICTTLAVHSGQFQVTENRYAPYVAMVASAPHHAYVFPIGSIQATTFVTLAHQAGWHITQTTFNNQYVIFHTLTPPPTLYPMTALAHTSDHTLLGARQTISPTYHSWQVTARYPIHAAKRWFYRGFDAIVMR